MSPPDPDEPAGPAPDARLAIAQLRAGMQRARLIVRAARQAIGRAAPAGAVLSEDPAAADEDVPVQAVPPPAE